MTNHYLFKRIAIQLSALACAGAMMFQAGIPVQAAAKIQRAKYEDGGEVDVDFRTRVQYRNPKITVKDNTGKSYTAIITEKDSDDLEFTIRRFAPGRRYTYKITGIRALGDKSFGSVTGTISIPAAAAPKIKRVKFDARDKEVEFSLTSKVRWSKPVVKISDGKKSYSVRITERDDDELEVRVNGLKKGKKYQYTITGATGKSTGKAVTLKGSFIA
ncbi:MAG: hypothetical protein J6I56_08910 [Lachnospiraceae bacterium]|nr:hypothetical protein [Lachnospiraceae bacterium]